MTPTARTAQGPSATSTATTPQTTTTAAARMIALGRAELTLLLRSKASLVNAVILPSAVAFAMRGAVEGMELEGTGLSVATVMLPAALANALFFAVYTNLVGVYVVRREGLVLKRLRTGELRDWEILTGGALPALLLVLVQSVLLGAGMTVFLDAEAPAAWHLVVALPAHRRGDAGRSGGTDRGVHPDRGERTTDVPALPVGDHVRLRGLRPREVLPDAAADIAAWLPFSPVMDLLRGGWTGDLGATEQLRAALVALAWTAVAVYGVHRRFRWEPRH